MMKILFLIHDLGPGGAEKVLVNLVNNMDATKFDITVYSIFDVGVNKQFLAPHIHYKSSFPKMVPGNSKMMKLLTPKQLHKLLIKEHYDIEVAYLEGPCSRIISGCPDETTKLVAWLHREQSGVKEVCGSFRNRKETEECYNRFNEIVSVSKNVQQSFLQYIKITAPMSVYYNTNESEMIKMLANEKSDTEMIQPAQFNLIGVGKLLDSKGFDRILKITKKLLKDGVNVHTYILGEGPRRDALTKYIEENNLKNHATLLGYQTNPYKYVAKCDLFVCASYGEGFSTAATEALIVGTPVCTVDVAGMKEMLGENNEYGVVVENNTKELYHKIKYLHEKSAVLSHYKQQAIKRGKDFSTEQTVKAVEDMLLAL